MRLITIRGLDKGYAYPCSLKAIKDCFREDDIAVGFGLNPYFEFDTTVKRHPKLDIKDTVVIASLSFNKRFDYVMTPILQVFKVDQESFGREEKEEFESRYINLIKTNYVQNYKISDIYSITYYLINYNTKTHEFSDASFVLS